MWAGLADTEASEGSLLHTGLPEALPPREAQDEGPMVANDFPPDDPVWDDFYATPFVLPPDPLREWATALT